jgi:hemerythrin-like domain-containing protein
MKHLPEPQAYNDPIRYFRDSHGVINEALQVFERLLGEVTAIGLEKSLAQSAEPWADVLQFFKRSGPRHEREEEETLFPVMSAKLPSIGFRSANDPAKFLSSEHFEMRRLTRTLTDIWNQFKVSSTINVEQIADFQRAGTELLAVYRQHIAKENEIIYKLANEELLSPDEREFIMNGIVNLNSPQSTTAMFNYDQFDSSESSPSEIYTRFAGEEEADAEEEQ